MPSPLPRYQRRQPTRALHVFKRAVQIVAVLYLAYLGLALLILNPVLEWQAPRIYHDQTGRTLRFDEIRYNPFTLALHARQLADPDGLWAVERALVDTSASSLWRRALVLDELVVTGVRLAVEQTGAERWNFSDILDHQQRRTEAAPAEQPEPAEPGEWPLMEVAQLRLEIAAASVRAPYLAEPFAVGVDRLAFTARDITTAGELAAGARRSWATFAAHEVGLGIDVIGLESLRPADPVATEVRDIRLQVEHFAVAGSEGVPFALTLADESGGRLFWSGEFSLEEANSSGRIDIEGLSLRPAWEFLRPRLPFRVASGPADVGLNYRVSWHEELSWQVENGTVRLAELAIANPDIPDTRLTLGELSLQGVAADSGRRVVVDRLLLNEPGVSGWNRDDEVSLMALLDFPAAEAETEEPAEPWQLRLNRAELRNGRVDWRASQLSEPLQLRELSATGTDVSWPAQQAAGLELALRWGDKTRLQVAGELHPGTLDGAFEGSLTQLGLTQFNPVLAELAHLRLDSGELDVEWRVALADGAPTTASADGAVREFDLRRPGKERDTPVAAWKQLTLQELQADIADRRLGIGAIALTEPDVRFRINRDGTTNFSDLMKEPAEAPEAATEARAANDGEKPGQPTEQPGSDADWQIAVQRISSEQGTLRFSDLSLPYPFRATIEAFTGAVTGLSSDPEQQAQVDFRGNVGGYAPVIVSGQAAPLATPPALDVTLSFDNVDMALLSPYSSTYAGYAIDRGLISVNLKYALEDERLRGSNRVLARQLRLGERVESPKAVDLPIRLALALLTDANGVIDLNVDVSGDIGDPKFGLGDVIRRAFFNAVRKVVTSPFRLLAQLGGSKSEDLGTIPFAPGATALEPPATEKLAALKRGLEQRPKLLVSVAGHVDPETDSAALREQVLQARLREAGLDDASITARDGDWEDAVAELHAELPQLRDAEGETLEPSVDQQWQRLLETIEINPGWLRGLANRRAQEVKQHLIDIGLPPERVLIDASPERAAATAGAPQASLTLEG